MTDRQDDFADVPEAARPLLRHSAIMAAAAARRPISTPPARARALIARPLHLPAPRPRNPRPRRPMHLRRHGRPLVGKLIRGMPSIGRRRIHHFLPRRAFGRPSEPQRTPSAVAAHSARAGAVLAHGGISFGGPESRRRSVVASGCPGEAACTGQQIGHGSRSLSSPGRRGDSTN
jgi:hypothetical protein